MKNLILRIALMGALAALPLAASAAMTDAEATKTVQSMLENGKSSKDVIKTLMEDGRSLQDATVLSVETATGDAKLDLAREGICMAGDVTEAEGVGKACVDVCTPATGDLIENLVNGYVAGMCESSEEPPSTYGTTGTAADGGSVSPAN